MNKRGGKNLYLKKEETNLRELYNSSLNKYMFLKLIILKYCLALIMLVNIHKLYKMNTIIIKLLFMMRS